MSVSPPLDEWFVVVNGMPQPLWWHVSAWIRAEVAEADRHVFWQDFIREWLRRFASVLGKQYSIAESEHFHMLSTLSGDSEGDALKLLERTRKRILHILGDRIALRGTVGKHLILRFGTDDEYFRYVSHWEAEGETAASGGMCIYKHYSHIAIFEPGVFGVINHTLAHELAHDLTFHLPHPVWLREGIAMFFETDISGGQGLRLNKDLVSQHRAFWNPETIQRFWIGESFSSVDGQHVSYSLADTLFRLIRSEVRPSEDAASRFTLAADWNDAGHSAALNYLGIGLDEVAAIFLGPGDWRPKPEIWTAKREPVKPEPKLEPEPGTPDENGFIWPEGMEPVEDERGR